MELNKNDVAVCLDSIDAPDSTVSPAEIDLYDELIAFAELPPEEQVRLGDQTDGPSSEIDEICTDGAEEQAVFGSPVAPAAVNTETASAKTDELATAATEPSEGVESHLSSEQLITNYPIEQVESELAPEEATPDSTETPEELPEAELTGAAIETVGLEPAVETETTDEPEENTSSEAGRYSPIEPAEPVTIALEAESANDFAISIVTVRTDDNPNPALGPRPSGPLSSFNLPPEIVYTGALSRGICLACGAESGADDLFCLTCGVFIDEIASTLPSNPICNECKQRIDADEIFCPWCGSSVPE